MALLRGCFSLGRKRNRRKKPRFHRGSGTYRLCQRNRETLGKEPACTSINGLVGCSSDEYKWKEPPREVKGSRGEGGEMARKGESLAQWENSRFPCFLPVNRFLRFLFPLPRPGITAIRLSKGSSVPEKHSLRLVTFNRRHFEAKIIETRGPYHLSVNKNAEGKRVK